VVGEAHPGLCAVHEARNIAARSRVAAHQPVLSQQPEVSPARDGDGLKLRRGVVGDGKVRPEVMQNGVDLGRVEAGQHEIKTLLLEQLGQLGELPCEDVAVPTGVLAELVVGDCEQALLRVGEPDGLDRRHHLQAEQLRCREPAMPGQDHVLLVDDDRLEIAGAPDARGDPLHLALGALAGVARVGLQQRRRAHLNLGCQSC
jgi:hypothetical protein